jgi:predicted RNA-binding Zn-ribbon protein involved in translation (DUF1610 family)/ribosomal protein S27E
MTSNTCPQCSKGQLYFSGDGRARECERCGYRIQIATPRGTLQQLIEDTTLLPILSESSYRQAQSTSFRISLAQGIGAVKEGDMDEAYYCLTRVLRGDWDEENRANAWLWLSQVVTADDEKRHCLEQVLALKPAHGLARRGLAVLDGRLHADDIIDPDQLEREVSDEPVEAEAEQFTCPQCAGHMNYTPDGRSLLCEFCRYQQELGEDGEAPKESRFGRGEFEQEFMAALATAKGHVQPEQMRFFFCHSCAVEFVLAPETISLTCPYCGAVYVTETAETHELIPPHALIPFQINEDGAKAALRSWFKQHDIERPRISPLIGIYLPVWTFDVGGEIKWTIPDSNRRDSNNFFESFPQQGVYPVKPMGWPQRPQSPKTEFISGTHLAFYDDVLVPADKKLPEALTKGFAEFDLRALVAYDGRYLADWPAERYQLPLADASLIARKKVMKAIRQDAHRFTQGQAVHDLRLNSSGLIIESFKHILLPMWLARYKVEGKLYDVAVNGQNGKVYGGRPQTSIGKFLSRLLGQ